MGLIDCETLKQAAAELYKIDPDIVMYGEGWRGDGDGFHGEGKPADTANVYSELYGDGTRVPVGGFNDEGRNALRGGNDQGWGSSSHLPGWGYMQRGDDASAEQANAVSMMILGIHEGKGGNPEQCINYASCHDNWTLFDQLYYTLGDSGKGVAPSMERVVQATAAAQSLIMLTNGVAFMQGGEEIFRSKRLNDTDKAKVESSTYEAMYSYTVSHNSYNAPASVNSFKWDRKIVADGVETKDYCAKIAEAVKLHSTMQKWTYPNVPTAGKTSSLGKLIENTYWAGKDKDNNTYYGSGGFQLDEYFIFLSGRCWSYTSFGDVAKCGGDPIFAVGNYSYDSTNKTVNLGYLDTRNWGGALVIFKRLSI